MSGRRNNSSMAGAYSTAEEVTKYPKIDPAVTNVSTFIDGPSFAAVKGVKIWINAFIPHDVPGLTKPYPKDPKMSMLPGPTDFNDCFLTDQRSFSSDPRAKSRMHSEVELDIT